MKLTCFEELIEKVVPWFIAVCLAVILWAVTGCVKDGEKVDDLVTIEIDGCEYLSSRIRFSNNAVLTHKGNCKNPIHKCE